eukprot:1157291-Pelagomonas_calceolata.AAC.6
MEAAGMRSLGVFTCSEKPKGLSPDQNRGSGNGGGGRRVNPRACTGGGKPGGGDGPYNRPRRAVPTSRPLLQASPLASAAAVTATGLSLSSAGAGSSIISTSGLGLPSVSMPEHVRASGGFFPQGLQGIGLQHQPRLIG